MKYTFRLDEGYDHFHDYPIYRVSGVNNDYIGEWYLSEDDAKRELYLMRI